MKDDCATTVLTYRYRVKDKHAAMLNRMARSVNFVWNYCNDVQRHAVKWGRAWPTSYDLHKVTSGASKELGVPATTINAVCTGYVRSLRQHKKQKLRYRGRKNLGWVPFRAENIVRRDGEIFFASRKISLWLSRPIPDTACILDGGSFSRDALGHWYINIVLAIPVAAREADRRVGLDLGLKALATLSTGEKIEAPKHYRAHETRLATAQQARKTKAARRIHAKIANRRRDFLHKLSTRLVRDFDFIAVGDVNASGLAKTKMAKSVNDAGWSAFRNMLRYKAIAHGATYLEVDESYSTQACSDCGSIGGPKGRQGLVIREWQCSHCDAVHDRDVNAARFILRRGLATLLGEPARLAA